jgi:hypothetical protein
MNTQAINAARRRQQDTELAGRINDEARIANELQAQTGCTRTAALVSAKIALSHCRNHSSVERRIGRHGECLQIKSTTDPRFIEHWSDHVQGRERCDELNRGLDHPAYFIA